MKRIFVSSTFVDLKPYRTSVRDAIRELGAVDVSMEHFGARDDRPKDECDRIIRKDSDVFVGIYAHRYGYVPEGAAVSILESEYEAATHAGLPRFIYLLDENTPWLPAHIDQGKDAARLLALKDRLKKERVCTFFTNKDDLATRVAADLGRYLSEPKTAARGHAGILHQPDAGWTSPITKNRWRYKVVGFDLDGTLLRGASYQFSWELIWNGLGFGRSVQSELKRAYRSKAQAATDAAMRGQAYREWCDQTCAAFKARKLSRRALAGFVDPLTVTNNLERALARLREEGFVLAIISGGIDFFLELKVPEFRKWFDFVFINEFRFDGAGLLESCVATEFDFDGKADALRLVCERAGCTPKEAVFVGDAFNDEAIMLAADRAIAYPPKDDVVKGISQWAVAVDDLEGILPHVLIE